MIAVKSPLSVSPRGLGQAISSYSELTSSPAAFQSGRSMTMSLDRSSSKLQTAEPPLLTLNAGQSEMSDPSPIASSNGTEGPENNDSSNNEVESNVKLAPTGLSAPSQQPELSIRTSNTHFAYFQLRPDEDEPPQSVIHAPPGFGEFKMGNDLKYDNTDDSDVRPSLKSDVTVKSSLENKEKAPEKKTVNSPVSPPHLTTTIAPTKDWSERATPRAQTRQEIEDLDRRPHSRNLEDIPEALDADAVVEPDERSDKADFSTWQFQNREDEINALRTALAECWTLCNTLESLSYVHRERLFNSGGRGDMQEQAWKSCWKLCQKLYDSRDDDYASQVKPTLDLCRDFCQALFEVRIRDNEIADSVLRVSFELNNHLYNTHDRNLPDAFRERTLDFYVTLCHRLMKQRMRLIEEADSLLRACWSLAEMLFSLRQNKREGKQPDEELLGSAVQACWELCDLFREGWSQIRPDRGTPRPSQTTFTQAFHQAKRSELAIADDMTGQQGNPETPTTIFEDTATVSPDEASIPNILVLGHGQSQNRPNNNRPAKQNMYPSNSSTLSGHSRSSEQTSSTNTVTTPSENPNLTRLKLLIIKAAMNSGYQRSGTQSLSSDSFGSLPWQISLLRNYKRLVVFDPAFKVVSPPARASAVDVARAVQAMVQSGQYTWLRDLYRLVFGFHTEEAMNRRNVTVQT
ncbi:hypothetical protein VTN02DRAFT_4031 [Thermoascus thermophilus]